MFSVAVGQPAYRQSEHINQKPQNWTNQTFDCMNSAVHLHYEAASQISLRNYTQIQKKINK